jgi:dTDP-4-dehydrorhamnose reductase
MRILLLGANGQLGRTFLDHGGLTARGELTVATRDGALTHGGHGETADLSIPESLPALLDRVRPDVIVNAAAYTAVDRAEQEEALATRVNGEAVGVLGRWAAAHGALLIHYSTDYVFDGNRAQPYAVDAPTGPLDAYGRSKLAGERALRDSGADHLILRTAWVYAAHGHNFLRTMLRLASERDVLRVVADQVGCPTPASLLADSTAQLLDRLPAHSATLHLTSTGQTSWHGFAEAIVEGAQARGLIARRPRVDAITTAEYPTPAARPAYSVLDTGRIARDFGVHPPAWQDGLGSVLDEMARRMD